MLEKIIRGYKGYSVEDYVIFYFDILGYKNLLGDTVNENIVLEQIIDIMEAINTSINTLRDEPLVSPEFEYRIFSDNVIIVTRLDKKSNNYQIVLEFIKFAWYLQRTLIERFGTFIRGAITVGNIYIDRTVLFGTGLITAYEMESKIAKYPRIILSDNMMESIKSINPDEMSDDERLLFNLAYKSIFLGIACEDDIYYIKYTMPLLTPTNLYYSDTFLPLHATIIFDNICKYFNNELVKEKYLWCKKIHDEACISLNKPQYIVSEIDNLSEKEKQKYRQQDIFAICGYCFERSQLPRIFLGKYSGSEFIYKESIIMLSKHYREIISRVKRSEAPPNTPHDIKSNKKIVWIEPQLVCTVKCNRGTNEFLYLRDDKDPRDCVETT